MKKTYVLKCICIDEGNDFGLELGQELWYNTRAQMYRYLTTKWSGAHWENNVLHVEDGSKLNPYFNSIWKYSIPMTASIEHAKEYKRLADIRRIGEFVESIGDFRCEIYVIKNSEICRLEDDIEVYRPNR